MTKRLIFVRRTRIHQRDAVEFANWVSWVWLISLGTLETWVFLYKSVHLIASSKKPSVFSQHFISILYNLSGVGFHFRDSSERLCLFLFPHFLFSAAYFKEEFTINDLKLNEIFIIMRNQIFFAHILNSHFCGILSLISRLEFY